jgi:D-alanyl-D-alanine carboxypeptidase/D-alanyl-D-alanine-endopeptidase (penicillin-binding protein 4)
LSYARALLSSGWIAAAVTVAACHTAATAQVRLPPAGTTAAPSVTQLRHDIDSLLADPVLTHAYWGILVRSLKTDETLYELNPRKLLMPASNMKIVTLAAAAERLGWEYRYETTLLAAGRISGGRLDGDLLVVGSGDPSLTDGETSARLFDTWAERLTAMGVQSIGGRVIGDDNVFDDDGLGFGWSWDDLSDDYAAGVSALQFNENAVRVTVGPGPAIGDAASIVVAPPHSGLVIDSLLTTSAADAPPRIDAHRLPGSTRLTLRGSMPRGSPPATRIVSVDNPTLFFVTAFRSGLIARGIDVRGAAVDIDDVGDAPATAGATVVETYRSPPLSTLAVRLMKASQNLYAETLLKTIGRASGSPTFAGGRAAVQAALQPWGVGAGDLIDRDGSGLSRYDFVTPAALVAILTHIARDETLRAPFEAALPIAGRDGTLSTRLKGTPAEGNARAKTGSMANVRALSGYVTSAEGEPLVWSIIANNFDTTPDTITNVADAIVVRLATFRR